jgi:hypothetical protein
LKTKTTETMKTIRITRNVNLPAGKSILVCVCIALVLLLASCSKEDAAPDFSADDTESVNSDVLSDTYFEDTDDLTGSALGTQSLGGKVETDDRMVCASVIRQGDEFSGTVRLDFGGGCEDLRGNTRKGAIKVVRTGRPDAAGGKWSVSYENYSINGIVLEGTREVTVVSVTDTLIVYDIVLTGGRITWPDGRFATREAKHRRHYERHGNHLLDRLIIYGTAHGTLRNGRGFSIEILERLIYRRACLAQGVIIPVSGKKLIKHGERELTVDYGDGNCDNFVTLTNKNGRTWRYEVGK